jgi:hypothetical protein
VEKPEELPGPSKAYLGVSLEDGDSSDHIDDSVFGEYVDEI